MTLTLFIENVERLDNGEPVQLKLDRHGAVIGRSPHADWSLPDPKNYISSTHCEIDYRNGAYLLFDKSTNGTFVNNSPQRLDGPHVLKDGDIVAVGHYRIVATTKDAARTSAPPPPAAPSQGWDGWGAAATPAQPAVSAGWDAPAAPAAAPPPTPPPQPAPMATSGWADPPASPASDRAWAAPPASPAPVSGGWDTPQPAPGGWDSPPHRPAPPPADAWGPAAAGPPTPRVSGWDELKPATAPTAPVDDWARGSPMSGRGEMSQNWTPPQTQPAPSAWDQPASAPAHDAADVWAAFAASNEMDWSRGGFAPAPATPAPAPAPASMAAPPPTAAPVMDDSWTSFLRASQVDPSLLKVSPAQALQTAGGLLHRLLAGLVLMMEARARAKAQLGAQSTTLELNGNNPLKFARSVDRLTAQLLNPPERGFMTPEQAIEDSFQDLQAHQMATLAAMQGALAATLARFSPEAIRNRAESRGLLAKIIPAAREAELWNAYEREFEGVARGSDEAFMDVFAKEFKTAYERSVSAMKRR